jgi:hypothetical protein
VSQPSDASGSIKLSIEQTIEKVTEALRVGVHPQLLCNVLRSDGYSTNKAELIVRWATQKLKTT